MSRAPMHLVSKSVSFHSSQCKIELIIDRKLHKDTKPFTALDRISTEGCQFKLLNAPVSHSGPTAMYRRKRHAVIFSPQSCSSLHCTAQNVFVLKIINRF